MTWQQLHWIVFALIAAFIGLTGPCWLPVPLPADAPVTVFSATRALEHVKAIAQKPHLAGSAENRRVREHLLYVMRELGLNPRNIEGHAGTTPLTDLYGELSGSQSNKPLVLLVAHHDSVSRGPGAADDASGVATILETIRVLKASGPTRNSVAVLFTDGEELGLLGAKMFVRDQPDLWKNIQIIINLEARGNHGPVNMFQTGARDAQLIRDFSRACPFPVAASFAQDVYRRMPNDTDFTVFLREGKQGFNFGFVAGLEYYHSKNDTPENLSLRTLQHEGDCVLGLTRYFANADDQTFSKIADAKGDETYFSLCRGVLVHYPAELAKILAFATGIFFLLVLVKGFISSTLSVRGVAAGFGVFLLAALLCVAFGIGGLFALVRIFKPNNFGPFITNLGHADEILIAMIIIVALGTLALRKFRLRKTNPSEALAGVLIPWVALTLVTQFFLAGGSYLFMWPALCGSLALLLLGLKNDSSIKSILVSILTSVPAALLLAPTLFLLYQTITIGLAPLLLVIAAMIICLMPVNPTNIHSVLPEDPKG